jgi:polysaccharide biosynthesis/export protein
MHSRPGFYVRIMVLPPRRKEKHPRGERGGQRGESVRGPLAAAVLMAAALLGPGAAAAAEEASATVRGAVRLPGAYELGAGETLSSLVERAGGFTDNAFLRGAALTRESARARQAEELVAIVSSIRARVADAPGDPAARQAFLDALEALSPLGRVPIRLSHPRLLKRTPHDIPLEPGDDLFVPETAATVRVAGAVRASGEFPASPGKRYLHYVETAGGFAEGADRRGVFLLAADGTAAMLYEPWIRWNPSENRLEFSAFRKDRPSIAAGDVIAVPDGPAAAAWLAAIPDYGRLLVRIAVLSGTAGAR